MSKWQDEKGNKITVGWGRAVFDEAYLSTNPSAAGPCIVGDITKATEGYLTRKWFVTGTPFESSSSDMAAWSLSLENNSG